MNDYHTESRPDDWRDVQPGRMYDCDAVAALFVVKATTVNRWAKKELIRPVPRLSRRQPFRFLGTELLRYLGEQGAALSGPSETPLERERRGEAARQRVRDLAGGRPTRGSPQPPR